MTLEFVLPVLALFGLAVALAHGPWELSPRFAVPALTVVASITAGTVAVIVAATAAGFVLGPARLAEVLEWCRIVPLHHGVGTFQGLGALAVGAAMATRAFRVVNQRRIATRGTAGRRLSILDAAEPLAYAAPGRPGCVAVPSSRSARGGGRPVPRASRRAPAVGDRAVRR